MHLPGEAADKSWGKERGGLLKRMLKDVQSILLLQKQEGRVGIAQEKDPAHPGFGSMNFIPGLR